MRKTFMSIRNRPHFVDLNIQSYSKKGNGIGYFERKDGSRMPVEVSFTVPGDIVRTQLLRKRSGIYKGRLQEITFPSPTRTTPKCLHFGVCGGCRWQHIPYELQLKNKEEVVLRYFEKALSEEVSFYDIIPSLDVWHYRNKMEFTFSSDKTGALYLGLVMDSGKGRVFHLSECHLPSSWFVDAVEAARQWWKESNLQAYHGHRNTGSLRTLTLREGKNTGDRMVILTVSGNPDFALKKHHLESFVAVMKSAIEPNDPSRGLSIFLIIQQVKKGQPTRFFEMHLSGPQQIREILTIKLDQESIATPLSFHISPLAFFQPNTRQAEVLYSTALRMAQITPSAIVYDLYCGTGVLGIVAAKSAKQVIAIELSPESMLDARQNAKENGVTNVVFITGRVEDKLDEIREKRIYPPPDIVICDPPRVGLEKEALKHIIALAPKKILYISCNPETQAKNALELMKNNYRLMAIQPIDQFPHTVHIENIAILVNEGCQP